MEVKDMSISYYLHKTKVNIQLIYMAYHILDNTTAIHLSQFFSSSKI